MQSMYNERVDKRVLSIRKGMELQVDISTDISDASSVMYQTLLAPGGNSHMMACVE